MTNTSLGDSSVSTGDRVFLHTCIGGKKISKLLTWSQRRCEICQRFLAKHQLKYCVECADKVHEEQVKEFHKRNSSEKKLRDFVRFNADKFNVGDIV